MFSTASTALPVSVDCPVLVQHQLANGDGVWLWTLLVEHLLDCLDDVRDVGKGVVLQVGGVRHGDLSSCGFDTQERMLTRLE